MGAVQLIGVAGSLSLLAGWRLYLTVFAAGLAMRLGWLELPGNLASLDVLANPWVLGVAGFGAAAEFFADKIAWLDSVWDAVHTAVRPVGGAMLALAVVDPGDPAYQVVAALLGAGAAFSSHAAKAGTRAVVNASPEPVSNIVLSTGEDVATSGALYATLAHPEVAAVVAIAVAAGGAYLLWTARKLLKRARDWLRLG